MSENLAIGPIATPATPPLRASKSATTIPSRPCMARTSINGFSALAGMLLPLGSANSASVFKPTGTGTGNFGQVAGATVRATPTGPSWTGAPLVTNTTITITDVSFIKNQAVNTGVGDLWVGVYLGSGLLTNSSLASTTYLGSSSASVNYNSAALGAVLSWSFPAVSFTVGTNSHLHFVLQTSGGELTNTPDYVSGTLSLRRFDDSVSNTFATHGAGVIHGNATTGTVTNRVPIMTVNAIPEPGSALLAILGMVPFLRRRR